MEPPQILYSNAQESQWTTRKYDIFNYLDFAISLDIIEPKEV